MLRNPHFGTDLAKSYSDLLRLGSWMPKPAAVGWPNAGRAVNAWPAAFLLVGVRVSACWNPVGIPSATLLGGTFSHILGHSVAGLVI